MTQDASSGAHWPSVIGPNSLIQGDVPTDRRWRSRIRTRRLEAVVLTRARDALVHYHRDQVRPDQTWTRGDVVSTMPAGPGAIAQEPGSLGIPGTLHTLVPESSEGEIFVGHYVRESVRGLTRLWRRVGTLSGEDVALACGVRGGVHALVRRDGQVVHLVWTGDTWSRRATLGLGTGSVGLAYESTGLLAAVATREGVVTYVFDGAPWSGPSPAVAPAHGASTAGLVFSPAVVAGGPGRGRQLAVGAVASLRLLAPPAGGKEGSVEEGRVEEGWVEVESVVDRSAPVLGVSLAPTALDSLLPTGRGWLQALVQEGESVYQYHRQEWGGRVRWERAGCLRFDPGEDHSAAPVSSRKLAQVTGERDTQPGSQDATLSSSLSRSGIRGTDLGVHVEHRGRSYLLFGDTHWRRPTWVTRDSIGLVTERGPIPGLPGVELHGSPLAIVGGMATSREYDVPLDGFSFAEQFFVFYSSNHFLRHQTMGRSILTKAVDPSLRVSGAHRWRPIALRKLGVFSDRYFVNVTLQRRGSLLYLWGSGAYRADDLRLAVLDLEAPAVRAALLGRGAWTRPLPGLRYWAGPSVGGALVADGSAEPGPDAQRWSAHEHEARPVVRGAFGEISVRWVPELGRYALLSMDAPEDPMGTSVTMRTSPHPWGPWSPRVRLFDWIANGQSPHDEASRFIRAHMDDPVGDAMFRPQRDMTGAAYAPYLFDSRRDADDVVLRYTLSTWNPYQVVLMEHRLPGSAV